MDFDEASTRVICSFDALANASKYFTEKKFEITGTRLEYLPKTTVDLASVTDARRVLRFMDVIEDMEDVQNLFGNYEISDEIGEQLEDE